jgi:HD-GYP domain-containing protein (c-di-GMP phosphodiesterase class II)
VVSKHVLIGADIIRPIRLFSEGVCIVRNHHEWYNGTGYPDGLKGEQIPLLARITAVADAFDAMTSDRPYRKSLTIEEAAHELRAGAGTQFDRNLVTSNDFDIWSVIPCASGVR